MTAAGRSWIRRPRHAIPLALLAAGLIAAVVWFINPWPASLLIRAVFTEAADKTVAEMLAYVPESGVDAIRDIPYAPGGPDTTLDVFTPSDATGPLPTVIWIHGGAWISGNKGNVDPYAQIIASNGYTVVTPNYTVGPDAIYPTALGQLNDALAYVVENADRLGVDPSRLVIAGDSAGSQLTSQLAAMVTNPAYAETVGIAPTLTPEQLVGVVLNCGIYDVSGIPNAPGIGGWGFRVALWAYLGEKDWSATAGGSQMSTLDDVTADFPTTWISGGNADPLTDTQSKPFAAKLEDLGVDVTSVFYPESEEPALPHEYQFHLDFAAAKSALASTVAFLDRVTG